MFTVDLIKEKLMELCKEYEFYMTVVNGKIVICKDEDNTGQQEIFTSLVDKNDIPELTDIDQMEMF